MFGFITKLFKRKIKTTKVITTDNVEIDVTDLNTHPVILKMRENKELSMTEINLLISDMYDSQAIQGKFHKFHKVLIEETVFEISRLRLVHSEGHTFIWIEMSEAIFGIKMSIQISPDQFHQVFKSHSIKPFKESVNENRNS